MTDTVTWLRAADSGMSADTVAGEKPLALESPTGTFLTLEPPLTGTSQGKGRAVQPGVALELGDVPESKVATLSGHVAAAAVPGELVLPMIVRSQVDQCSMAVNKDV